MNIAKWLFPGLKNIRLDSSLTIKGLYSQAMVAYVFNPSIWESEAGRSLSSRPAWSRRASSRTGTKAIQRNSVSKNKNKKKTKTNKQKTKQKTCIANDYARP